MNLEHVEYKIGNSVYDSMWNSVWGSVRVSVWDSVVVSVAYFVGDSVNIRLQIPIRQEREQE